MKGRAGYGLAGHLDPKEDHAGDDSTCKSVRAMFDSLARATADFESPPYVPPYTIIPLPMTYRSPYPDITVPNVSLFEMVLGAGLQTGGRHRHGRRDIGAHDYLRAVAGSDPPAGRRAGGARDQEGRRGVGVVAEPSRMAGRVLRRGEAWRDCAHVEPGEHAGRAGVSARRRRREAPHHRERAGRQGEGGDRGIEAQHRAHHVR